MTTFDPNNYNDKKHTPKIIIDETKFKDMKAQLEQAIDIEATGLDDFTLKKLLLSYYRTCYLTDTEIYIELDGDEMGQRGLSLVKAYRSNLSLEEKAKEMAKIASAAYPYNIVNKDGNDFGTALEEWWDDGNGLFGNGSSEPADGLKMGGFYLKTNGIVKVHVPINVEDEKDDEETDSMHCYTLEGLTYMYELEYKTRENTEYGKSVKEYLKHCYAFDDGQIKTYAFTKTTTTEETKYSNNDSNYKDMVRNIKKENSTEEGELVTLDYQTNITKYTTPVEFFVDLMEISGSRDFIDAVIEMLNDESIDLQLYELIDTEKTKKEDIYNRTTTVTGKKNTSKQLFDITYTPVKDKKSDIANRQEVEIEPEYIVKGEDIIKNNPNVEGINQTINKDYYYIKDINNLLVNVPDSIKNNQNSYDHCQVRIVFYYKAFDKNVAGSGTTLDVYNNNNYIDIVKNASNQWVPDEDYSKITYLKTINGVQYFEMNTATSDGINGKDVAESCDKREYEDIKRTDEGLNAIEKKVTTTKIEKSKYEIGIKNINVWHGTEKVNGNSTTSSTARFTENEDGDLDEISKEDEKINLNKNEELDTETHTGDEDINSNLCTHHNKYMWIGEYDAVERGFGDIEVSKRTVDCNGAYVNSIFNYLIKDVRNDISNGNSNALDYTWDEIKIQRTYTKSSVYKEITETTFVRGQSTYIDNTDRFLSLLSNEDGKYEIGKQRNFKSKKDGGKVVTYPDLYDGKSGVGELLENGADMLFELLESNEHTEPLTDTMKYIMHRYSGNDYGVTTFNFVTFNTNTFSSVSGGTSALTEFTKAWENGALRGYINGTITDYNSNFYIYDYITEDKKYYKARPDSGNTWSNNRNFGFGVCFFYGGSTWNNVGYFADEGISEDQLKSYREGDTIEVEIVDRIKEKIEQEKRREVENMAASKEITLEDYQIDALADCGYQGYYISAFLDAYKQYGLDERIRSYCDGMNSNCIPPARGEARWKLFSTGKYTDQSGNEIVVPSSSGSSATGETILKCAKEVHDFMSKEGYIYGSDLKNTFEESKTSKHAVCASYVSWVLQEAGIFEKNECSHGTRGVRDLLAAKGWKPIKDVSKLEPGDILFYAPTEPGAYASHVDIAVDNNHKYSAGDTNYIQKKEPLEIKERPFEVYRAPK